jgi:hypothetical protein
MIWLYEKKKAIFLLIGLCGLNLSYSSTFNNQLSLAQFGTVTNNNISLQPSSLYPAGANPVMTNNFQTLQLKFGEYLTGRYPCRVGQFNVTECESTVNGIPFGPQVSVSSYILAGNGQADIPPNENLIQVADPNSIIFSCTEATTATIHTGIDISETRTVCSEIYEVGGDFLIDLGVPTNAFHDIRYNDLTPKLFFGSGLVIHIELDGAPIILPTSGSALNLPAATKFKFVFRNPASDPPDTQTWLIYAQTEGVAQSIQFQMNYTITGTGALSNVVLTAKNGQFPGFLRVAVIQPTIPLARANNVRLRTTHDWQLATALQSIPATPLSMFMLWPESWTQSVGVQMVLNQNSHTFISSCPTNSLLIPLLARSNFPVANCWYDQLIDKQMQGQKVFDIGTNAFVTLFNMLIAHYYDADIQTFQSTIARGVSTPNLGIASDPVIMETMFDNHRSEIPVSMEIEFNPDSSYEFYMSTLDSVSTFPQGKISLPLLCFPGYQTLADGFNIVNNATNKDPIKGDINYVEGNIASVPGSFVLTMKGQPLPLWAPRFLPDDFWTRLKGSDKTNLICQLNRVLEQPFPQYIEEVYIQGKALFQIAMTAVYATYVLLAQQGFLPPYPPGFIVPASVKSRVQPLITLMENILNTWLITQKYNGQSVPNYFAGDTSAKGVIAVKGASSSTGGVTDSGNAVYTGHNRQYGYFLESAALAVQLDLLFQNPSWIGSTMTNAVGTTALVKQFVDMLWRDYANPATDDAADMPFYRYGNAWEGMSCSKGLPPVGAFPSRENESISEDFNGYYGSYLYANAIQSAPTSQISAVNQQGFNVLQYFSNGNLAMIMRAARALFYNNGNWVYVNTPFNFNQTTGTQWDNMVTSSVYQALGNPPCYLSKEGCLYSKYKFDLFCTDLVNQFNSYCQCQDEGCSCQE